MLLATTHFQIQAKIPFFNKFEHGWPIKAFLSTYLINRNTTKRKRRDAAFMEDEESTDGGPISDPDDDEETDADQQLPPKHPNKVSN